MPDLDLKIRRLERPQDAELAYCCMTEVPTPWPASLCTCRDWMSQNLGRFVEGYHLQLDSGEVIGHIYYAPSERALIPYEVEANVTVMYCEWIQVRHQKQGYGHHLFNAFLEDMRRGGSKGILVEGTDLEGQMHVDHFLSRDFQVIYESGHQKLLFRPLSQAEITVVPLQRKIRPRSGLPVEILILNGYMCPFEASTLSHLREVIQEFGNRVQVRQLSLTPESLKAYGAAKGVFINGRQKLAGAETEEAIRQAILEEIEGV